MAHPFTAAKIKLPQLNLKQYQSQVAKDAAAVFHSSAERCLSLARMPSMSFYLGMWIAPAQIREASFMRQVLRKKATEFTSEEHAITRARVFDAARQGLADAAAELLAKPGHYQGMLDATGDYYMETSKIFNHENEKEIQHVLGALIISSWGALEVLTEQISEGAHITYKNTYGAFPKNQKHMFGYASIPKMRNAYNYRFGNIQGVNKLLDDEVLDAISILRNVIAHRGAIADDKFHQRKSQSSRWLKAYKGLNPGDAVKLSGDAVHKMIDKTFKIGRRLIKLIDPHLK